jgi:predicted amidohydrolase
MKPNRREFLMIAGAVGLAGGRVSSAAEAPAQRENRSSQPGAPEGKAVKSRIRVAQIKVFPEKGKMATNHKRLTSVLGEIEEVGANNHSPVPDVVVTPEGFLDGYVSTEPSVTKADMVNYAVDPATSEYTLEASAWARRNETWFIYGCTRKEKDQVFNTALIYDRSGSLVGMYDKLHLQ